MDDLIRRQDAVRAVTTRDGCGRCEKAIKNMPSAQQWIPCSERMPEKGVVVLTQTAKGYMTTNKRVDFDNHSDMPSIHFETWFWGGNYVAWMPLPSPYKEDDDG